MDNGQAIGIQATAVSALLRETGQVREAGGGDAPKAARDEEGAPLQQDEDIVAEIAELLAGGKASDPAAGVEGAKEGEAGDGEGAQGSATDTAPPPASLAELAQKLGVEARELYGVRIGLPGGEEATLSQLKDEAIAYRKGTAERLSWEEQRETERADLVRSRDELRQLLELVPREALNPQALQHARAGIEQYQQAEARKLLERVPEWRDRTAYEADRRVIDAHLSAYGFNGRELDSVYDHRLLAYIRHNALREQRLAAALENAKQRQRKGSGPASAGRSPQPNNRAARRAADSRVREVANILRGSK